MVHFCYLHNRLGNNDKGTRLFLTLRILKRGWLMAKQHRIRHVI